MPQARFVDAEPVDAGHEQQGTRADGGRQIEARVERPAAPRDVTVLDVHGRRLPARQRTQGRRLQLDGADEQPCGPDVRVHVQQDPGQRGQRADQQHAQRATPHARHSTPGMLPR
jgi:hypothetical protein